MLTYIRQTSTNFVKIDRGLYEYGSTPNRYSACNRFVCGGIDGPEICYVTRNMGMEAGSQLSVWAEGFPVALSVWLQEWEQDIRLRICEGILDC